MSIFISHSSMDAKVAETICEIIEKEGKKCFIAPRDIHSGKEYAEELLNGIDNSEAMILVLSENANRSPHVLREVERAVSKAIPILVYKLEEVELTKSMEYFLMTHQWVVDYQQGDYSEILNFVYQPKENSFEADKAKSEYDKKRKKNSAKTGKFFLLIAIVVLLLAAVFGVLKIRENKNTLANRISVGDEIVFGRYNGEEITWRVLRIYEDKKEAVLIAENILTIKAYDAAESGTYNSDGNRSYWEKDNEADTDLQLQMTVRGNNDWSVSNIRTWLNSEAEVVKYEDQPPMPLVMSEHKNGYHNEAGFLNGFTKEELLAIADTTNETNGNALADAEKIRTTDKVFLLSLEELSWFEEAGMSHLAVPTEAAIANDGSGWYEIDLEQYEIDEYYWWTREPVEGTTSQCYMVTSGYTDEKLAEYNVGLEGFGIRPAITIDLEADFFK